jgi:hypothetical protein
MALPARFSLLNSELNGFLFASMGQEKSGASLTVLSALTRLDVDPWAEGARLANLPKEAAARALATLIARFPADYWSASEVTEIAKRLVELLPKPASAFVPANAARVGRWRSMRRPMIWLFWFGLGLALIAVAVPGLWPWR